jgi:hypothetical protein
LLVVEYQDNFNEVDEEGSTDKNLGESGDDEYVEIGNNTGYAH